MPGAWLTHDGEDGLIDVDLAGCAVYAAGCAAVDGAEDDARRIVEVDVWVVEIFVV